MRAGSFSMQLSKFCRETPQTLLERQRDIIFELGKFIVLDSPVDRGTFRGNWRFSYDDKQIQLDRQDKSGAQVLAELRAFVDGFNGGTMYLLNGMPYGVALEYGWSQQAPGGMVRRNVARINAIVARMK